MNTIKDQVKKTKVQVALSLAIAVAASLAPEEAVSQCIAGNRTWLFTITCGTGLLTTNNSGVDIIEIR